MTQTRPDSTAGTRQAGWIKPPLVDRPVDRGRKDHQSRPFDRDPARDPPGRPMLPHDKTVCVQLVVAGLVTMIFRV